MQKFTKGDRIISGVIPGLDKFSNRTGVILHQMSVESDEEAYSVLFDRDSQPFMVFAWELSPLKTPAIFSDEELATIFV